jgi:hypothetical protein
MLSGGTVGNQDLLTTADFAVLPATSLKADAPVSTAPMVPLADPLGLIGIALPEGG